MPLSIVLKKLHTCFPDAGLAARAAEILETYGAAPHETGGERVILAILKLCEGDLDKLQYYVRLAKSDWRDVVAMAEYPEMLRVGAQMRELDGEARRAIRERDLAQYRKWLKGRGC